MSRGDRQFCTNECMWFESSEDSDDINLGRCCIEKLNSNISVIKEELRNLNESIDILIDEVNEKD